MKRLVLLGAVSLVVLNSCGDSGDGVNASCNPITDSRDGQSYCTVTIGSQTWMAENLNYQVAGSYCYDDNPANCSKYGRLYEYGAAENSCPSGWHLPSKDEWWTLFDLVNKTYPDSATYSLWAKGFKNWPQAFDAFGFSVVPAGIRKSEEVAIRNLGHYRNLDEIAFFQVREPSCTGFCHLVCLSDSCDGTFLANNTHGVGDAISVRCLKDEGDSKRSSNSGTSSSNVVISGLTGDFTDSRDGQTYKTVTIGAQTWMAENLNFKTESSYCYNDSAEYCSKYGRLYSWVKAKSACPIGWHLPTHIEWNTLLTAVGDSSTAGAKLKSTFGWNGSGNGTDDFSFSALPAGGGGVYCGGVCHWEYSGEGDHTSYWSSTEGGTINPPKDINLDGISVLGRVKNFMTEGYVHSVRCLKD
jgi:uncharacterized protein (TIGR02145 family)